MYTCETTTSSVCQSCDCVLFACWMNHGSAGLYTCPDEMSTCCMSIFDTVLNIGSVPPSPIRVAKGMNMAVTLTVGLASYTSSSQSASCQFYLKSHHIRRALIFGTQTNTT